MLFYVKLIGYLGPTPSATAPSALIPNLNFNLNFPLDIYLGID